MNRKRIESLKRRKTKRRNIYNKRRKIAATLFIIGQIENGISNEKKNKTPVINFDGKSFTTITET